MIPIRLCPVLFLVLFVCFPLHAEIPLPDAIFYGTITRDDQLVGSGDLVGIVERGGDMILEAPGEFTSAQGVTHYVLRIPMETTGVTPLGSDGSAAREGDVLARLMLDGDQITSPNRTLAPAALSRVDVGGSLDDEPLFIRGDCNGDGQPDVSDAIKTLLYLFERGGSPDCEKACDANDDGGVNLADAVLVLGFLVSGGAPPSPPYPGCGLDPSPDDLLCALGASGCGVDGRGGEVVAKARGGKEKKETRDREVATATPELAAGSARGDGGKFSAPAGVRSESASTLDGTAWRPNTLLEVTPRRIRMGEISGGRNVKTLTFHNRSGGTLQVSLASGSETFSVSPSRLDLPPDSTFVAFVESRLPAFAAGDDASADSPPDSAGVDVFENDLHLGRVPIEFTTDSRRVTLRVGNVVVAEGTSQAMSLPVDLPRVTHSLVLEIAYGEAFEDARFEPARGVESRVLESDDATSLRLELTPGSFNPEESAGNLLLWPRAPLAPGSYPVWIRSFEAADGSVGAAVSVVHGEVCAQVPWLDVDGDGGVSLDADVVLLERFVRSQEPLIPPDWPPGDLDAASLRARIEERTSYFDVDGSGVLDGDDLVLIDRALNGLPISGSDEKARLWNLYVRSRHEGECAGGMPETFSIADVRRLLAYLFHEGELECPLRFDADGDGELSVADALLMARSRMGAEGGES